MKNINKREVGSIYENKSVKFLEEQGYSILEKNYRNKFGEIDIISKYQNTIVFIEVKYRKNNKYGYGYEAVDLKKMTKILRVAQQYIQQNEKYRNYKVRFDCISYLADELEWLQDIAWGDEIGL